MDEEKHSFVIEIRYNTELCMYYYYLARFPLRTIHVLPM